MQKIENKHFNIPYLEISVASYYCLDLTTGLELYSGTLESHKLTKNVTVEDIKGGENNDIIASITKSSDLEIEVVDVVKSPIMEAMKMGGKIETTDKDLRAMHMPTNYEVTQEDDKLVVTLSNLPDVGEEVAIYNNKTKKKLALTEDYTISGKVVTITAEGIAKGDTVFVTGFYYIAPKTTEFYEIINNSEMNEMLCVVQVPLYNASKLVAYKQYIFPRAKMDGNFENSGNTDKGKTTESTKIKVLKPMNQNKLGNVLVLPIEDN